MLPTISAEIVMNYLIHFPFEKKKDFEELPWSFSFHLELKLVIFPNVFQVSQLHNAKVQFSFTN